MDKGFNPFSRNDWKKSARRVMRGEKHNILWDLAGWTLGILIIVEILRGIGWVK